MPDRLYILSMGVFVLPSGGNRLVLDTLASESRLEGSSPKFAGLRSRSPLDSESLMKEAEAARVPTIQTHTFI